MPTNLTPDQVADRATRLLEERVATVRKLAEAQAAAQRAREAEQAAFVAAEKAGWSVSELAKLGFDTTAAKATRRRRRAASGRSGAAANPAPEPELSTAGPAE